MRKLVATLLAVLAVSTAQAQTGYVSTDAFGYNGTIRRYTSLADAQAGTNAVSGSPFVVPARDLGLYIVQNNLAFGGAGYSDAAILLSAWYLNGGNTPSNSNLGFVQLYDTEGGSVTSRSTTWDQALTTFSLTMSGGNTLPGGCSDGSGDCGRLWNAGSAAGSSETTAGKFFSYDMNFMASGLTTAIWNPTTGVYESNSNPVSVTGSFTGIFENTSSTDPSSNGFYAFDLAIDNTSLYGAATPSVFGASQVVPEPSTYLLMAAGLAALGMISRRRRSNLV